LVTDEAVLPYQRPPLSKALLKEVEFPLPLIRAQAWYDEIGVTLRLSERVVAIDRIARRLTLQKEGKTSHLVYDHLVLATGAQARSLHGFTPDQGHGIHAIRHYADALRLRSDWDCVKHLLVVGGGFIGLEVAATARALGKRVTLVEAGPRLLERAVSPELSEHVLCTHREQGVELRLNARLGAPSFDAGGRFSGAELDGEWLAADGLLVSVGSLPNVGLAEGAGLACGNGIVTDTQMLTSDPSISAIGDCASFPAPGGGGMRLESVQNAQDQARVVASRLLGHPVAYQEVPWFWSDQGALRLQMTGLWQPGLSVVRQESNRPSSFTLYHLQRGSLVAVESVNSPADHMVARKFMQKVSDVMPAALQVSLS
jgi:3-phenylpropionate/trans-cinnamate dioxygenase ferredoxin reductase subunit